jgi:hypothetical protein
MSSVTTSAHTSPPDARGRFCGELDLPAGPGTRRSTRRYRREH